MTTDREKGLAFQRKVKKYLKERGFTVFNMPLTGKMLHIKGKKTYVSQKNDIFGCDLVARKSGQLFWVQATLDSKVTKRELEFEKYFDCLLQNEHVQLWTKRKGGEINIKEYHPGQGMVDVAKIIRGKYYGLEEE